MADASFNDAMQALRELESEQREKYRPKQPEQPANELEAYARELHAAQSKWVDASELLR